MATRATYTFQCNEKQSEYKHNFYIHFDGYPEGCVNYLKLALIAKNKKNFKYDKNKDESIKKMIADVVQLKQDGFDFGFSLHNDFMRANDECSLMTEKDCKRAGDLDYRYTFTMKKGKYFVTVEKYTTDYDAESTYSNIIVENMPLIEFMKKHDVLESYESLYKYFGLLEK